jgi:hypothetical protein
MHYDALKNTQAALEAAQTIAIASKNQLDAYAR